MVTPLAGPARYFASATLGVGAGMALGLVGAGGAQIVIPSLTHPIMGLSQAAASGVSLASLSVASSMSIGKFLGADAGAFRATFIPSRLNGRLYVVLPVWSPRSRVQSSS
jgi:uncharacterized membrane protein YfcA